VILLIIIFRVPLEQLAQVQEEIGLGKFSRVYSGMDNTTGKQCAIKVVDKTVLNEVEREMLRYEISIVQEVNHPNIIKFWRITESGNYACFISELVTGGELYNYIAERQKLKEEETALVIYYLLEAIRYLHSRGIVHRDLKPENVLLELSQGRIRNIKIIDFGLSKNILPGQSLIEQCGTLAYVAPEVLLKYGYGTQADLWSIGVIMYLM